MSEITLSDFVGYVFSEIVRAREIADQESKRIALKYADDPIMKFFTVPRFKIPEMDLAIPVLISGARFSNSLKFIVEPADFTAFITGKLDNTIKTIQVKQQRNLMVNNTDGTPIRPILPIRNTGIISPVVLSPLRAETKLAGKTITSKGVTSNDSIAEFYNQLVQNQDPAKPEIIVQDQWFTVFWQKLQELKLQDAYNQLFPNNDLFKQTLNEITDWVKQNTVVSKTKIENLLVNPETNMVKTGSTEASVFVVQAKIVEEGIFIRTIKEEGSDATKKIVEFD